MRTSCIKKNKNDNENNNSNDKYCGECFFLNYTEQQQIDFFSVYGYKPDHFCKKFREKIQHEGNHPELLKYKKCI